VPGLYPIHGQIQDFSTAGIPVKRIDYGDAQDPDVMRHVLAFFDASL
jgi:hypothetical protein